jgi:hypothetical protein
MATDVVMVAAFMGGIINNGKNRDKSAAGAS